MGENAEQANEITIKKAPVGLAVFALVGPSMVWAAEYIGSGEVILATRTGAILGTTVLWAIVLGIFLKFWIGMSGARYTVCTGEGMIDMFERIGPFHLVVWVVLVIQFICAIFSIGAVATAAGVFVHSILPINTKLAVCLVTIFAVAVAWSGAFNVLKIVMSFFVLIIVLGVIYVAVHVFPGFGELLGSLSFRIPEVPDWAERDSTAAGLGRRGLCQPGVVHLLGVRRGLWCGGGQELRRASRCAEPSEDEPRCGGENKGLVPCALCRFISCDDYRNRCYRGVLHRRCGDSWAATTGAGG